MLKSLEGFDGLNHGALATSADGRYLAGTSFPKNGVRVWDLQTEKQLAPERVFENSAALAFVPNENSLLVKHSKYIVAYDIPSLKPKGTFQITFAGRVFGGSPQSQSIAVSADGTRVAAFFNGVRLWDVATRRELEMIQPATDEFKKLAISPDGNLVAYAKRGPTIVWDYVKKAERYRLESKTQDPTVAFSPAGDILATSNRELGLHFVDAKTGAVIRRFAQFGQGAYPVAFSPDGKRIAAAWTGEIRIIDLDTEAEIVIKIPPLDEKKDR
jgi:WD40 repeat protein